MFQVKLIIFFLIVSVAGGGYVYVQKLRADNATLKINTTKLQGAVEQNEATIKQQTEDFEKVPRQVSHENGTFGELRLTFFLNRYFF